MFKIIEHFIKLPQSKFYFEDGYELIEHGKFSYIIGNQGSNFPIEFTNLLKSSYVAKIKLSNDIFYLFITGEQNINSFAFLTKKIHQLNQDIHDIHKKFIDNIGTIIYLWNLPSEGYFSNIESVFPKIIKKGLGEFESHYEQKCKENNLYPLSFINDLTLFATESNGNQYLYDKDGKIYMYAHDHVYDELKQVSGTPEYTLYRIKGIPTLREWLNALSRNVN